MSREITSIPSEGPSSERTNSPDVEEIVGTLIILTQKAVEENITCLGVPNANSGVKRGCGQEFAIIAKAYHRYCVLVACNQTINKNTVKNHALAIAWMLKAHLCQDLARTKSYL